MMYFLSLGIFGFSLFVFVLAFLLEVAGSLFGHFLVSWLHLFCACFVLCVVCKTCSQFICFGSQQNPPFGQHLSFARQSSLNLFQSCIYLLDTIEGEAEYIARRIDQYLTHNPFVAVTLLIFNRYSPT